MRCKACSKVRKHSLGKNNKFKCWRLWCLCPACATQIHKDEYPKNQIMLWANGGNRKKDLNRPGDYKNNA